MKRHFLLSILTFLVLACLLVTSPAQSKYMGDFEFIKKTVATRGAAVKSKKIDWRRVCDEMRPEFARCKTDSEHVANVMRLLAYLRDSHTGVTSHKVDAKSIPQYADGLYGGGLRFAWGAGRFMLQGIAKGHPKKGELALGSALVAIDGIPVWLAMEQEKRMLCRYFGSSSDHWFFSSLANRLLPFKEKRQLEISLMSADGKVRQVKVPRWGPGGRGFDVARVQLPNNLKWGKNAVCTMLVTPWSKKVGYLRITGSMNEGTVKAVNLAMDQLKGIDALLLDCRFMGGGSDYAAWKIAGRLFKKAVANGNQRKIVPTGTWQFDGPVVMLQNENEVSSAETFTWAVTETDRVISVGRKTGGWGIIPRGFSCPSGLVSFRLGVNDRGTPIRGIHTEGVGWPADIDVPYGPLFCAEVDPVRRIGLEVLQLLHAGCDRTQVRNAFAGLMHGDLTNFEKKARLFAKKAKTWRRAALADLVKRDLSRTLDLEIALLQKKGTILPELVASKRRLLRLTERAKAAKLTKKIKILKTAHMKLKKERMAQLEFFKIVDFKLQAPKPRLKPYFKKHGKTRFARWAKKKL